MRVLLVASEKGSLGFDRMTRLPNFGLSSIAANLDKSICDVKVVDLIVSGRKPLDYYQRLVKEYQPDVVGLSCMTFQYDKTVKLAELAKSINPKITTVLGGYHPTSDYKAIAESENMRYIDFIVRGEGEAILNDLIKALQNGQNFDHIPSLTFHDNGSIVHTERGSVLNLDDIAPPDRNARILKKGFHLFGYPADSVETSRGCVYDCNFCSIPSMYGKNYRTYDFDRILNDIRDAEKHGAKALLISDDNPTLNGKRYMEFCDAVIDAELNHINYYIQASVKGIKKNPGLAEKMVKAGARWVFLGIENESNENLEYLIKSNQFQSHEAYEVVRELKSYGAVVFGGIIIGSPDDDEAKVWANYEYVKKLGLDYPIFLVLTPYPNTGIREKLLKEDLITNKDNYTKYNCFDANVKTKYLSSSRLNELRHEIEAKYPLQSGAIFRLIREFPLFFLKLIPQQIFQQPKKLWRFIKSGIKAS